MDGANGGLALAFDAREFESARSTRPDFARLIERWQVRSGVVHEKLLFIKRPTALQPTPAGFVHEPTELKGEKLIKRKRVAAEDAIGKAKLELDRTLRRYAWVQRVARVLPYALMGLGALMTIAAGIYASQRLLDAQGERRQETIERVADDAMGQQLSRQATTDEPPQFKEANNE